MLATSPINANWVVNSKLTVTSLYVVLQSDQSDVQNALGPT